MKKCIIFSLAIAFIVVFFSVLFEFQQGPSHETPPSTDKDRNIHALVDPENVITLIGKSADADTLNDFDGLAFFRKTEKPINIELRPLYGNNLKSFFSTGYEIRREDRELWKRERERIASVQESPDGTKILFYNYKKVGYELYQYKDGKLIETPLEIPHRDQATRVNAWFWLGNNRLIGEHCVLLDPVPYGFEDEGWTKEIKFFVFDLETRSHFEVAFPEAPEPGPEKLEKLKDKFKPSYQYNLSITRYHSIKGLTDDGLIFLMSFDTSQPRGGNPKDEGWFKLEDH